jgi:hypothetical protein
MIIELEEMANDALNEQIECLWYVYINKTNFKLNACNLCYFINI